MRPPHKVGFQSQAAVAKADEVPGSRIEFHGEHAKTRFFPGTKADPVQRKKGKRPQGCTFPTEEISGRYFPLAEKPRVPRLAVALHSQVSVYR